MVWLPFLALVLASARPPQGPVLGQKLNGPITAGVPTFDGQVIRYVLVPDSRRALFLKERSYGSSDDDLCVAPLDRSARPLHLNGAQALSTPVVFQADPGSTWAVYASSASGLRSVRLDGSAPPVLLGASSAVSSFAFGADGASVVFLAHELFVVPIDGSAPPRRLSGALVAGGDVTSFVVGGGRAVYRADQEVDERFELYSVPLDGSSAPVRISAALVAGGDVSPQAGASQISPDGSRVAYLADQSVDNQVELYGVPIGGGAVVALSGALVAHSGVRSFRIDPSGTRAAFLSDRLTRGEVELFSAPLDGSELPVRLNGPLVTGGDVSEFLVTPDGARAVYLADQEVNGKDELFSVLLDGSSAAIKLNQTLASGKNVTFFDVSATRAVYRANPRGPADLFSVPLDRSSAPVRLYEALLQFGVQAQPPPVLGADGKRVVFCAEPDAIDDSRIVSARIDGSGQALQLDDSRESPSALSVTPDGSRAVFLANYGINPNRSLDLFSVPMDASRASVFVNEDALPTGDVLLYRPTLDGERVVYVAQEERPVGELRATGVEAGFPRVFLGEPALSGPENLRLSADGELAFFEELTPQGPTLFRVPTDGSRGPNRLSTNDETVLPAWDIAGDDPTLVYEAKTISTGFVFLRALRGPGPLRRLTRLYEASPPRLKLALTPDGGTAVFFSSLTPDADFEVYAVPTAGGPIVRLSSPSRADVDLRVLELDPRASNALYVADARVPGSFELHAAPVDAGAPAVTLNPPLRADESVGFYTDPLGPRAFHEPPFVLTPDGLTAVFALNRVRGHAFHLYRAPLDGSAAPTLLADWPWVLDLAATGPQSAGAFAVDPRGKFAVYQTGDRGRLFSVRMDLTRAPVELGQATAAGGGVPARPGELAFRISADGRHVVYLADEEQRGRFELYRVPLDGSGPAVRLSDVLQPAGEVLRFALDGEHVVYLADQERDGVFELYHVALLGGPSAKLNPPLVEHGGVQAFTLLPGRVFYRADQDTDDVLELYLSTLPKIAR